MEFAYLVGRVLEVAGVIPGRVRIPPLPFSLVLELAIIESGGGDLLHFPFLLTVDLLTSSRLDVDCGHCTVTIRVVDLTILVHCSLGGLPSDQFG